MFLTAGLTLLPMKKEAILFETTTLNACRNQGNVGLR